VGPIEDVRDDCVADFCRPAPQMAGLRNPTISRMAPRRHARTMPARRLRSDPRIACDDLPDELAGVVVRSSPGRLVDIGRSRPAAYTVLVHRDCSFPRSCKGCNRSTRLPDDRALTVRHAIVVRRVVVGVSGLLTHLPPTLVKPGTVSTQRKSQPARVKPCCCGRLPRTGLATELEWCAAVAHDPSLAATD